jgi:hypothetical protein
LCTEISFSFAIAKNNSDGLRLDVKNVGRNLFVNSISAVFGRKSGIGEDYKPVYESPNITPEQKVFSEGHNSLS